MTLDPGLRQKADEAFSQARRRAFFQGVLGLFTRHRPPELLSLDQVRHKLRIRGQHYHGLDTIPIDQIVGSLGRYRDFDRAFLPRQEFLRERWKRIYEATHGLAGLPPIDVFKVGEVYFVRDGHHRVSVLKELGADSIEATVTELDTPVPLSADVAREDLDLKAQYAAFLEETDLGALRPEQRIEFSVPGQYQKLSLHVAVHRHYLGLREEREIPYAEAVGLWYDQVYCPLVALIRTERILNHFPGRTEADLYLWIAEHRHYLSRRYGEDVPLESAAADFSKEFSDGPGKRQLEAEVARAKKEAGRSRTIAVFGSGSAPADHPVLAEATRLGHLLARAGFSLMTGGYGGTMEASSRGARQADLEESRVIGVTMDLFTPPLQPNPWLTDERRVSDFFPRLKELTSADAFVVLSGGIGTLTEATLVWSLLQTGQIQTRPLIFVGQNWHKLIACFRAETLMSDRDLSLATMVATVDEAVAYLDEALGGQP
ncbi:DUF4032 domain-containing protein [Chloroflexota bacterium]